VAFSTIEYTLRTSGGTNIASFMGVPTPLTRPNAPLGDLALALPRPVGDGDTISAPSSSDLFFLVGVCDSGGNGREWGGGVEVPSAVVKKTRKTAVAEHERRT